MILPPDDPPTVPATVAAARLAFWEAAGRALDERMRGGPAFAVCAAKYRVTELHEALLDAEAEAASDL